MAPKHIGKVNLVLLVAVNLTTIYVWFQRRNFSLAFQAAESVGIKSTLVRGFKSVFCISLITAAHSGQLMQKVCSLRTNRHVQELRFALEQHAQRPNADLKHSINH